MTTTDVKIVPVKTKKEMKRFVRFPTNLYKDNKCYVPPIELDELNMMNPKKNASFEDCDAQYFLAYQNEKVVGRIGAIISFLYNKKNDAKRVRFTRFDCINDSAVAKALFQTAEAWAKERGMTEIHGPLGFNDLEREGLMVSGFENEGLFVSSYNYDYYQKLVEENGFKPDCKWLEWQFPVPSKDNERLEKVSNYLCEKYGLYVKEFKNDNDIIKHAGKRFFELLDICYENLYGTIPFTEKLIKQYCKQFKMVIDPDFTTMIYNKDNEMIGYGLAFSSLAKPMIKSRGRYLPFGWIRILHAINHPKTIEMSLIAVHPDYQKLGVTALIINGMLKNIRKRKMKVVNAAPELETNVNVFKAFDMFERKLMREKICYLKKL